MNLYCTGIYGAQDTDSIFSCIIIIIIAGLWKIMSHLGNLNINIMWVTSVYNPTWKYAVSMIACTIYPKRLMFGSSYV